MPSGFPLLQLLGVEFRADRSWLLVLPLVSANLAVTVFPGLSPHWGAPLTWAVAGGCALAYLLSVLLHELAHLRLARAFGVHTRRVTLHPFGGIPDTDREPPSPGAELVASLAGPIASLALGGACVLLGGVRAARVAEDLGNPVPSLVGIDPQGALLFWLGSVNLALGLFNLLPGFPLDGGRALRAVIWGLTDNPRRATRWSSYAGQAVGGVAILAGVGAVAGLDPPFLPPGTWSGVWLALLGWLLLDAAARSRERTSVHDLLEGVAVSRLMRAAVPVTQAHITVSNLVHDRLMGTPERAFPVLRGEELVGLVTLPDIRRVPRVLWAETSVEEIMTPADRLATTAPDADAAHALRDLTTRDVAQLPVLQNNRLVGLLRRDDILTWLHRDGEKHP